MQEKETLVKKRILSIITTLILCLSISLATIGCGHSEQFTVWFEGNGGGWVSGGKETQRVTNAKDIVLPNYERENYEFLGWDIDVTTIKGDQIVKAKWRERYFLTFDDGSVMSVYPDEPIGVLPEPAVIVADKAFYGWAVDSQKLGQSWIWKSNKEARAIWLAENEHFIELIYDDGYLEDAQQNQLSYVENGDDVTIINPVKDGYDFKGWKDLNNPDADLVTELVIDSSELSSDLKYQAQWTGKEYTLTLNARSGYLTQTQKSVQFGEEIGELQSPTNGVCRFLGWYYQGKKVEPTDIYQHAEGVEFLARYEYTITYELCTKFQNQTIYINVLSGTPEDITVDSDYVVNTNFPKNSDIRLINAPSTHYFYGWTVNGTKFDGTEDAYPYDITVEELMESLKNDPLLATRKIKKEVEKTGKVVVKAHVAANWSEPDTIG